MTNTEALVILTKCVERLTDLGEMQGHGKSRALQQIRNAIDSKAKYDTPRVAAMHSVLLELEGAQLKFAPFNSAHEGWAVLKEEMDELWDEVKAKQGQPGRGAAMRREAVQVAAMALRFIIDCNTDG